MQELFKHLNQTSSAKGCVLLKLDLEKAFDRLEWSFIHRTLAFFGFPSKLSFLIMHCITTSSIFVLVNGSSSLLLEVYARATLCPRIFLFCARNFYQIVSITN